MLKPFHLSTVVPDLRQAENFYQTVLGCETGRDRETWIDVNFFGHQLTLHQQSDLMPAVAIDHFGPVLGKHEWLALIDNCTTNALDFVLPPVIRQQGTPSEQGKFIIQDTAGNLLEFKYYLEAAS